MPDGRDATSASTSSMACQTESVAAGAGSAAAPTSAITATSSTSSSADNDRCCGGPCGSVDWQKVAVYILSRLIGLTYGLLWGLEAN